MTGWMIFRHAVGMVLRNWRQALQISGLLYAVLAIFEISLGGAAKGHIGPDGMMMSPAIGLSMIAVTAGYVILSIWIAVAWHRYVLLEEMPEGWVPKWHGGAVASYLGISILITLVIAFVSMVIVWILSFALGGAMPLLTIVIILLAVGAGIAFFRLSPMLPAAAIGEKMKMSEAWHQTRGLSGAILLIVLLQFGLMIGLQIASNILMMISPVIGFVGQIAVNWFATIVTASLLTTFYGHFVQERPLV